MPRYKIGPRGDVVEAKPHRVHYLAQAKYGPHAKVMPVGTRSSRRIRQYGADMTPPRSRKGRNLFARIMASLRT